MKSYKEEVFKALLGRGWVSRLELNKLTTHNCPEYVRQLRKDGWDIETRRVSKVNRFGKKVMVGEYYLRRIL